MGTKNSVYRISILSILVAVIVLQDFIPFIGNIPIGPLSLTTLHVTVIVTAIILGPMDGAVVGGVWGMLTWIRAFVAPSSPLAPLVFVNPLVSVFPRILIGVIAGYVFIWLRKATNRQVIAMIFAAICGSLTNSLLVLSTIYFFYKTPAVAQVYSVDVHHLFQALIVIFATNGVAELILAAIVVPLIATPLLKFKH